MRLRRHPASLEDELEVPVEVEDEPTALLDHYCHGAGHHRLLGVAFREGERLALRAGDEVRILVSCDRCIWQRRIVFRLRGDR